MVIKFTAFNGNFYTFDVCGVNRIYHNGDEIVVALKDNREFSTYSVAFESV